MTYFQKLIALSKLNAERNARAKIAEQRRLRHVARMIERADAVERQAARDAKLFMRTFALLALD